MREWLVAGGVVRGDDGLLLVRNRRKDGRSDWSTPGGVIDAGETVLDGLTREVREETGLRVDGWERLVYRVEVSFPGQGWNLRVESHLAGPWAGTVQLDDPDGIVVDARFVSPIECVGFLEAAPRWVAEPLVSWLVDDPIEPPLFRYFVSREASGELVVDRRQ